MAWYAIEIGTDERWRVKQALEGRVAEVFDPRELADPDRDEGQAFYPGYLFVRMELTEETRRIIAEAPGVKGFVGGQQPAQVPDSEIAAIREAAERGETPPRPRVVFE